MYNPGLMIPFSLPPRPPEGPGSAQLRLRKRQAFGLLDQIGQQLEPTTTQLERAETALADGESVLLHGGGGGVTTAAIQLVQALLPASPIFVTASPGKTMRVREQGVAHVIDYRNQDFAAAVAELTKGRGVDVILDHIGAAYLEPNLACLALYGRLVIIGLLGGPKAELNIGRLMIKRQRIIGSVLRARPVAEKAKVAAAFRAQVLGRFATGELKPVIHEVLPLAQARRAHELMAANANTGKLILEVDPALK